MGDNFQCQVGPELKALHVSACLSSYFVIVIFFRKRKKNVFNLLSHEKDGTLIWTSPINYASGSLPRKIFVFIVLFCSGFTLPHLWPGVLELGGIWL